MIIDLPLPPEYRLVQLKQYWKVYGLEPPVRMWFVAVCVDDGPVGHSYGSGEAGSPAIAAALAVKQSRLYREQALRAQTTPSLGDLSDILNDLDI